MVFKSFIYFLNKNLIIFVCIILFEFYYFIVTHKTARARDKYKNKNIVNGKIFNLSYKILFKNIYNF